MYSAKIILKSVKKLNDIIIENTQENKLKISLTKPLNAATIEDIRIIDIIRISIPLKILFNTSIYLSYLRILTNKIN